MSWLTALFRQTLTSRRTTDVRTAHNSTRRARRRRSSRRNLDSTKPRQYPKFNGRPQSGTKRDNDLAVDGRCLVFCDVCLRN